MGSGTKGHSAGMDSAVGFQIWWDVTLPCCLGQRDEQGLAREMTHFQGRSDMPRHMPRHDLSEELGNSNMVGAVVSRTPENAG